MQSADVSVIIPTYNRVLMLEEALNSVLSQDFEGIIDVVVVDDNSQDGTSEFVKRKYPQVRLISLEQNVGAYAARNQAIQASQSQYIAFLDSDDLWEPNYLSIQVAALINQQKCFAVSAVMDWRTVENQKWLVLSKPNLEKYSSPLHHLLAEGSFICTPSAVVFPRKVFDEIGWFDSSYRVSGDNDFYIRCLLNDYRLIYTEQSIVTRRIHDQGQATNWSNLNVRKNSRLKQINKYYALAAMRYELPPIRMVRAQVHALYASRYYLRQRDFSAWLGSSLQSVYNAPVYGLLSMWQDIRQYVSHYILRDFQVRVKKKFLSMFKLNRNTSRA